MVLISSNQIYRMIMEQIVILIIYKDSTNQVLDVFLESADDTSSETLLGVSIVRYETVTN